MKRILIILLAGLIIVPAFTQDNELPAKVDEAFKTKYPKAKSVYGYSEENNYKIEFEISQDTYTAIYSESGNWIETAKIISDSEVPAKAISTINKKHQDIQISYAELIENSKAEKYYRLNCYTDEADYIINVTAEGTILHTEKKINTYESDYE